MTRAELLEKIAELELQLSVYKEKLDELGGPVGPGGAVNYKDAIFEILEEEGIVSFPNKLVPDWIHSGWFITKDAYELLDNELTDEDKIDRKHNLYRADWYYSKGLGQGYRDFWSQFGQDYIDEYFRSVEPMRAKDYVRLGVKTKVVSNLDTDRGEPIYVFPGHGDDFLNEFVRPFAKSVAKNGWWLKPGFGNYGTY